MLVEPDEMSHGSIVVPRLVVELDRNADRLANIQAQKSVCYYDIQGEAPRVGQIFWPTLTRRRDVQCQTKKLPIPR